PNWFQKGFEYVSSDDFGSQYTTLLHQWLLFEASYNWGNPSHGLKKTRPQELTTWISQGKRRPPAALATIAALSTLEAIKSFAERTWTWWCELQPAWRAVSNNRPVPFNEFCDNYLLLDKHGQNGWLGLLICMKWWR
ncbi:hypothetical protein BT96DRAFT_741541, partial [Gymnopus androsaceus JB14]